MKKWMTAVALSGLALPVWAAGIFVPAPSRVDMVHDEARGLIYISNGSEVLRYQPSTGSFLSSIALDGQLSGLDISPDNQSLVVADRSGSLTHSWVYVVDLATLAHQTVFVSTPDSYEGGTYTAVYDATGMIYTTSTFNGSGWVPLRRLDPATGVWTNLASVRQNTMLSASGDGLTVAFAEANSSAGPWGLIDVPTGSVVRRSGSSTGSSWFLYEIASDRHGAQFATPSYGGTFVYDDVYARIATIGTYAGAQPIGVAYHPVERIAYFPFAQTSEVRVFDMDDQLQISSYDAGYTFLHNGNHAFQHGRTRLSRDGSLLMVSVGSGLRVFEQYAPLSAEPVSSTVQANQPRQIALPGSIGNGGSLAYSISSLPGNGTVSISGSTATYTPNPGFSGADSFGYRVRYGRAAREATVSLTVVDSNQAPVAVDDSTAARNSAILIPVLLNDSDPDGDPLTITMVTAPNAGAVTIQGSQIRFTPPKKWPALVTFAYTISDGRGKTASATVTVRRN